jgi:sugar phosphate isomerase/epimerase
VLEQLRGLPGESIWFELDLGWAWEAGADPVELLERFRGRAPVVHVKDFRARGTREFCPVGDGAVGYDRVLPAAAGLDVEWLLVEQDEIDGPPLEAVARSLAAVRRAVGVPA